MQFLLRLFGLADSKAISYQINTDLISTRSLLERASAAEGKVFFVKKYPLKFSTNSNFTLTRMSNRNAWRRYLCATLEDKDGRTTLTGQFRVPRIVIAFTFAWIILVSILCFALITQTTDQNNLLILLLPTIGILLPHLGRLMSRQDEQAVIELLDNAFGGHVVKKTFEM